MLKPVLPISSQSHFLILLLLFFSKPSLANENLESFWLGKLPEIVEKIPDMQSVNITIQSWAESALFQFKTESEVLNITCHYHSSNSSYHCSKEQIDFAPPENFQTVLEMSSQTLSELVETMGVSQVSSSDPVWPWVIGALAVFYVSKKVLNYWVNKSFTPKPHSHEFSLLSEPELEESIKAQLEMINSHTKGLEEVFNTKTEVNFLERETVRALLEERIKSLNKKIIDDLVGSYCSTCKTVHAPNQTHHHSDFQPGSAILLGSANIGGPSLSEGFIASLSKEELPENLTLQNPQEDLFEPKSMIERSIVLRTTKALLIDIHNEFIKPIPRILKYTRQLVSKKENLRQLHSYAQTKLNTSIGESNILTGIAIASSLISIKVVGETLETMVVGPFHVLCQLSDVAAITAGLAFLATYHSCRQPLKLKQPGLFFRKRFWSLMLEKFKNPTLNGRILAAEQNDSFPASEALILEFDKLKSQIQRLIWELKSFNSLTSKQAKDLARKLGAISKEKEDIIFDVKIDDGHSPKETLNLINRLKPIHKAYQNLLNEISSESRKTSLLRSETALDPEINTCSGILRPASPY